MLSVQTIVVTLIILHKQTLPHQQFQRLILFKDLLQFFFIGLHGEIKLGFRCLVVCAFLLFGEGYFFRVQGLL